MVKNVIVEESFRELFMDKKIYNGFCKFSNVLYHVYLIHSVYALGFRKFWCY